MATARMREHDPRAAGGPEVVLVAMPWQTLNMPSIQLGILQPVLERAGIRTEVRSLYLAFMEHCRRATAGHPPNDQIHMTDYDPMADGYSLVGLGDWIFAVPPFRHAPDADVRYVAYLRGEGIPASVVEKALAMRALVPDFLERCAEDIVATGPRVVGFTSTFSPAIAIIFGGHNCNGPMGAALHRAFPWVDVVVRGEAEEVLPGLVKDLLAAGPVRPQPGLCYRQNGRSVAVPEAGNGTVSLDEISTPVYDEYFARLATTSFADEIAGTVQLLHETARGCWWGLKSHCTFCGRSGSSLTFRSKSPDRVFREITSLAARYGRLDFQAVDDILDLRYCRKLLPRLRDAGYNLDLLFDTKANLTREQVHLLKQAGVNWIQPGIESLSTPILKQVRKGVTAFQNIRLLKWCAEYGIHVFWNVIYGFPTEPPEEYARMAALAPSLAHLQAPMFVRLHLERFSPYHERPQDWGLEIMGPTPHYALIYPADGPTLADLAYTFEYRYADGRDPKTYVDPLRRAIQQWQANEETGSRSLRYRRGPGFIVIRDRRPGLEPADYTFEDLEAKIYLACEDGATAAEALAALGPAGSEDLGVGEVREFLDDLVNLRLAYEEGGRYLALALPANLLEHA